MQQFHHRGDFTIEMSLFSPSSSTPSKKCQITSVVSEVWPPKDTRSCYLEFKCYFTWKKKVFPEVTEDYPELSEGVRYKYPSEREEDTTQRSRLTRRWRQSRDTQAQHTAAATRSWRQEPQRDSGLSGFRFQLQN